MIANSRIITIIAMSVLSYHCESRCNRDSQSLFSAPVLRAVEGVTPAKLGILSLNIPLRVRGIKGVTFIK